MDSKIYFMFELDIFNLVSSCYNHKIHVNEKNFKHTHKILLFREILNASRPVQSQAR